ncbi:unnamed protein product [Lactuca virosa]|uniref:Uncharacterized protein n=1 Tax=Lactuca virosa TaxID=75947 RepID=A0AAU9LRC2_9ASTR|nr:unnamed protein product [Lactuca virosa]
MRFFFIHRLHRITVQYFPFAFLQKSQQRFLNGITGDVEPDSGEHAFGLGVYSYTMETLFPEDIWPMLWKNPRPMTFMYSAVSMRRRFSDQE